MKHESAAKRFVLRAIQDWGQSDADRIGAVQAVLDAAGIRATATCGPVFGGIWPKSCNGPEAQRATAWLKSLTESMKRGEFNREAQHVDDMIEAARVGNDNSTNLGTK